MKQLFSLVTRLSFVTKGYVSKGMQNSNQEQALVQLITEEITEILKGNQYTRKTRL